MRHHQYRLVVGLFAISLWPACGNGSNGKKTQSQKGSSTIQRAQGNGSSTADDFNLTINPIMKASCGGASCHDAGSPFGGYVGSESTLRAKAQLVMDRITSTDRSLKMPPDGTGKSLSDGQIQTLQNFLKANPNNDPGSSSTTDTSTSPPIQGAGIDKLCLGVTDAEKGTGLAMAFSQVNTILAASCGGGVCHTGARPRGFVGDEAWILDPSYGKGIIGNLSSGVMPTGGRTISAGDKRLVFGYICARRDW